MELYRNENFIFNIGQCFACLINTLFQILMNAVPAMVVAMRTQSVIALKAHFLALASLDTAAMVLTALVGLLVSKQ